MLDIVQQRQAIQAEINEIQDRILEIHTRLPELRRDGDDAVHRRNRLNERLERLRAVLPILGSCIEHLATMADSFEHVHGETSEQEFSGSRREELEDYLRRIAARIRWQRDGSAEVNSHQRNFERISTRIENTETSRDDLNVTIARLISEKESLEREECRIRQRLINLIHSL